MKTRLRNIVCIQVVSR